MCSFCNVLQSTSVCQRTPSTMDKRHVISKIKGMRQMFILRSDHDWHQAKGFTTFRCLEPLQLIVWKKRLFLGFLRFVRVPPYESWANWTNFYFSCENGDILLSRKSCNLFHTKNEEKSQKISTRIRIPTCIYANTWQGGPHPALNRVNRARK